MSTWGFDNIDITNYDELLKYYSEEDILNYYFGEVVIGEHFSLRENDSSPSAIFRVHEGRIRFKDFGSNDPDMDVLDFIRHIHPNRLGRDKLTYKQLINSIFYSLKNTNPNPVKRNLFKNKVPINISASKKMDPHELAFWHSRKIKRETLKLFDVRGKTVWRFGDFVWHRSCKGDPLFLYVIDQDKIIVQGYRPTPQVPTNEVKGEKFRSKNAKNQLMGLKQLPESGHICFLTKGYKDVMTLYQCGFPAVCPFGENIFISASSIKPLLRRFKHVVTFFDNDKTGIARAKQLKKHYDLPYLWIPRKLKPLKDPNDYVWAKSHKHLTYFINKFIKEKL